MALQSVATNPVSPSAGTNHDLWIDGNNVLTIRLDRDCKQFPPAHRHCRDLNRMIQGLARAAKAVVFQAENGQEDADMLMEPLERIADAIVLLSQLSDGVLREIDAPEAS